MKKIEFEISIPIQGLQKGKKYTLNVEDNTTFLESLALVDKIEMEELKNTIFPIYEGYIHSYLQLFINLEENSIYPDVGIYAYAPDEQGIMRKFNPIRENIEFNLYPDSIIQLQPDVGCWWEKVKERLDLGTLKTLIRQKYGENNRYFAHYFSKNHIENSGWALSKNYSERGTKGWPPFSYQKSKYKMIDSFFLKTET